MDMVMDKSIYRYDTILQPAPPNGKESSWTCIAMNWVVDTCGEELSFPQNLFFSKYFDGATFSRMRNSLMIGPNTCQVHAP